LLDSTTAVWPDDPPGGRRARRRHALGRDPGAGWSDVQAERLRRDVQALVDRLVARGLHPSTVRNAILPLRMIYRRAIRDELVSVNPTRDLDLPRSAGRASRAGRRRPKRRAA
jgi:site-specific recombinase XerC